MASANSGVGRTLHTPYWPVLPLPAGLLCAWDKTLAPCNDTCNAMMVVGIVVVVAHHLSGKPTLCHSNSSSPCYGYFSCPTAQEMAHAANADISTLPECSATT